MAVVALGRFRLQAHAGIADAAWSRVQAAVEKRHELGRQMAANVVRPDDPAVHALQDALTQAEFVSGWAMKSRAEDQLTWRLRQVLPIGGDERFVEAAMALTGAFEAIQLAVKDYNAQVCEYNKVLGRQAFVARLFQYGPREELCLEPMEDKKP